MVRGDEFEINFEDFIHFKYNLLRTYGFIEFQIIQKVKFQT